MMPRADSFGSIARTLTNANTAAVSAPAASTTYLTGSSIVIPYYGLKVGTWFRWTLTFTKTAAGTAARSHLVKVGRLGTTGDATVATLTSGTPTGVVDTGLQIITFVIWTLGASATSHAASHAFHQLSTTGLFANETESLQVAGSTFDSTLPHLIVGLAVTTGASEVLTYQQVLAEAGGL